MRHSLLRTLFAPFSLLVVFNAGVASRAPAQSDFGDLMRQVPADPQPADVNEVEDVDGASDPDLLGGDPGASRSGKSRLENDELSYSYDEIRSHYDYGIFGSLGQTFPWQTYAVEGIYLVRPDTGIGLYFGGGHFTIDGNTINDMTYNSSITARSAGISGRYWIRRLGGLSVQGAVGYGAWEGHMSPHGSDDQASPAEKLTSEFQADGILGSLAFAISWVWPNGLYVEWTPVGVQAAHLLHTTYSHETDSVHQAVQRDIEHPRVYGLVDLKVGCFL